MSTEPPAPPPPASGATPHPHDPMPPSPITEAAAAAVQLHEACHTYVGAGFTEAQAFEIVLTFLRTTFPPVIR